VFAASGGRGPGARISAVARVLLLMSALAGGCTRAAIDELATDGGQGTGGEGTGGQGMGGDGAGVGGEGGSGTGGGAGGSGGELGGQGGAAPADAGEDAVTADGWADALVDSPSDDPLDGPSPGVPPTQAGQLVVTEIMIDTRVVTDDDGEWFELYNPSADVTYDLQGCVMATVGATASVGRRLLVPPRSFITLGRNSDPVLLGFVPTYGYGATLKFENSGSSLTLSCGPGGATLIDQVSYVMAEVIKGSSRSLSRAHSTATENDNGGFWCAGSAPYHSLGSTFDYGSPGAPNPDCP
jgi:hypothetical protein